jgi:antitoxin component YwqK of YwqJK toxin-antitoxin module
MKIILALSILFTITASSQDTTSKFDYDNKIQKISDEKYQIKVVGYDSLSHTEGCFLGWMNTSKGKPDGELVVLDENGKRRYLAKYKGGARIGTHYAWYSTGEVFSVTNWETDMYFNTKGYYESGKILYTSVNGNRENAVYTSYYENGKVESITDYSAQIERTFYDNGQIKTDRSKTKKTYTEWYRNGKIKLTGSLDKDTFFRIGKWSYYDEKGKLIRELFYDPKNTNWYGAEDGYLKEIKY